MTYEAMIRDYNRLSAAHKYIVGLVQAGTVYYITASWKELCKYLKADHASSKRGGELKARIRVPAQDRKDLIASGRAVKLCDASELVKDTAYNRGENFERVITETLTHTVWKKDSIPFYVQGDIRINGEEIQVKLDSAELTNEKTLKNAKDLLK